ncbi:MAG TPA: DUF1924 domain-containing protein [Gallionella sp.]|nr:DUF1924 domain-containing protein [Gallionella sp.]
MLRLFFVLGLMLAAHTAFAETPESVLATLKSEASGTPGFLGFSAARGEAFFKTKHGGEWSCTSCHTENTAAEGKHAKTGKVIKPIAPSANAERFTDMAKVEKWFKRNCNDVLERVCTPQEKGDVLTYLLTVK